LCGTVLWAAVLCADAAETPSGGGPPSREPAAAPVLAATVDGEPIYVHEVERELELTLGDRPVDAAARPLLQAAALEQLVRRQLILGWLQSTGQAASARDVDFELERLKRSLERQRQSLEEYCRRQKLDERQLRKALEWQLSWRHFLDKYLTEENLQRHFERHQRELDGTRLRVAHILLKVDPASGTDRLAEAVARAEQIRQEIVTGTRTFAQAAKEYSQAPSAADGGDLGFISRHEPMPEGFSRAAYRLQPQEVSRPVTSAVGVHLITCVEEQPGQRTAAEAGPELEQAARRYLFEWAAQRRRGQALTEYSGAIVPLPAALAGDLLETPAANR